MSVLIDLNCSVVLFFSLFFPIISGALIIPFCYFLGGNLGFSIFTLVILDYFIPLRSTPLPWYYDFWMSHAAYAFYSYFPNADLRVDPALKIRKDRRYLLCAHPHGIFGMYIVIIAEHFVSNFGLRFISFAAPVLTLIPIARRHFNCIGLACADSKTMRRVMKFNHPLNVFYSTPGGIEEMFCVPEEIIVISKRKGFCKIAIQRGCDLVPIYGFGNNQMFPVITGRKSFLGKLSKIINVSIVAFVGRFNIPYLPMATKHPQLVAIGEPILVEKNEDPSQEEIDELHEKYCIAIRELFDKYKTDPSLKNTGFASKRLYFENEEPETSKRK